MDKTFAERRTAAWRKFARENAVLDRGKREAPSWADFVAAYPEFRVPVPKTKGNGKGGASR